MRRISLEKDLHGQGKYWYTKGNQLKYKSVSGNSILEQSAHAAHNLASLGVSKGDRICICANNSVELVTLVIAALRSGIIPAVISSQATERELTELTHDIDACRVFRDGDLDKIVYGNNLSMEIEVAISDFPQCRPMHFTSGTTGRPKAVWSGWLTQSESLEWVQEEIDTWELVEFDTHLVNGPLNHSAPLRFAIMTVFAKGSLIIPEKFTANTALELMINEGVTTTFAAPAHLQRIMAVANPDQRLESMRLVAHAGSFCPDHVRIWAHEYFGVETVVEFYGSTEGQFTICLANEWRDNPGSVGRARQGRQLITDAEGQIWCQVPDFARFSYWGDEAKSQATWRQGNWFSVGDYGRIDSSGYLYLEGRKGDLIISGGVNVYPAEIERVLSSLQGVAESVAFGLPDSEWGQRVCVAVLGTATESEIDKHLREQLSGPKRPKSVFLIENFPRTHSGKVDRIQVAKIFG